MLQIFEHFGLFVHLFLSPIYQVSYDEKMGRWSNTSVFELVKDPWLPYVYFGIILMLLGTLGLFLLAKKDIYETKQNKKNA